MTLQKRINGLLVNESLRWFCRRIPLIHDLINIFTLKPSIFDKKLNLLEK
ncbi:orotate phosphoribosyltransferase [Helicobacter pylori]|nr:orotate phosphoribosyltransferase [Helicobacter pylori]